ncbi:MAG: PHP domain-containing protein [Kiritimatiellia bacterium]
MIDLHVHSTASDGTSTPEELAAKGRDFALMALTDHDTCAGARRFLAACRDLGVARPRWAGCELSLDPGAGGGEFHMLGLGIDPDAPVLAAFLEKIRAGRHARNLAIVEKLNAAGVDVSFEEVQTRAGGEVVARPHFGRVLIDKGYAKDMDEAFAKYLGRGAPAYVSRFRPGPEEAIETIHAAGGLAIVAHPNLWTEDVRELEKRLAKLKDAGLDGIEALYKSNAPGVTVEHLLIASRLALLVSAGSDFHGTNRSALALGVEVADEAAFVAPLLARRAIRQAARKA